MIRICPVYLILALGCLGQSAATVAEASDTGENSPYASDNSGISDGMRDLMLAAQSKYLEGSSLIKAGDPDKAREAFDKAVDLLLQSEWDLTSTPMLNRFFQDLIQRIQEDESRYLEAPYDSAIVDNLDSADLLTLKVDTSLQDELAAEVAKTDYTIPITINDMVAKSLDFWLNRGRKYFVDGLLRSGQYRPIIEKVFREESIPLDLMYLAQVESLFKPNAVSKARAKGIWQFERGTALRYGLKVTRDVDERSDPEKSTRAAAHYLNDLFAMFKDWNLVLAAYNWGEGKVQRLIDTTGLKDFWQLVDLRRKLPEETRNHIPLIHASVILARNPEKYGLPTELDPPLRYSKVSVSKPIDLRAAAKVLATSLDELKKLNPALRGLTTPANYPNFQLKVPAGSAPDVHEQLAALPTATIKPAPEYTARHKVRPGETLSGIAARYHVSVAELERANNLSPKKKLTVGALLQVPSAPASRRARANAPKSAAKARSGPGSGRKAASLKETPRSASAAKQTASR